MIQVLLLTIDTPANSSAQSPAESDFFIGSTLVLSTYLLKVFCKEPVQKGHFVKIWVGHFVDSFVRNDRQL
jgi:hypothetical protein